MESKHPHLGITMHRLRVGGDFPGLIFAVGSVLIFLFAIPALGFVLAGALAFGLLMAAVLRLLRAAPEKSHPLTLK
jgi:hypothetical protein